MSADGPQLEADQIAGVPLPEQRQRLVGHQAVLGQLLQQAQGHRVPGAILLHGPRGIGKTTLAFQFARDLLSATGDEPAARVGEQIAQGVHPNVFVLRRGMNATGNKFAEQILIHQITRRERSGRNVLMEQLHQTRGRAGHRVCIIDSIDDCNTSATNALLKILEEPPADTLFMLISHRPGQLLPTIRSRCHAHGLRRLNDNEVGTVLDDMPLESDGDRADAVRLANGRPRRAYEMLAHGGVDLLVALRNWLANAAEGKAGLHLALADQIAAAGGSEKALAREMIMEHLAGSARHIAETGDPATAKRLASATELWDKASAMFAEADIYNLDERQTLVAIFDAIRQFSQRAQAPVDSQ